MKIVETILEYNEAKVAISNRNVFVFTIWDNLEYHPAISDVVCIYVYIIDLDEIFVFSISHKDAVDSFSIDEINNIFIDANIIYTPFKKDLLYIFSEILEPKIIDLAGIAHIILNEKYEIDNNNILLPFYRKYESVNNVNSYIPLLKLIEYADCVKEYNKRLVGISYNNSRNFLFHNNVVIPTLYFLEKDGLEIDSNKIKEYFGERSVKYINNNKLYSKYNPYTITGRVSNSYGGINFSALNKHSGEREAFISRFDNGRLILIDFDSFHIRLIGDMIDIHFDRESVHTQLAKQYYNTDEISPEMYESSKQQTFKLLYSNDREDMGVEFFKKLIEYKQLLWETGKINGYIESPEGRRFYLNTIEMCNQGKLFNYLLQAIEMEVSMKLISKLEPLFEDIESKIILYTYDSILIDFDYSDGRNVLKNIIEILEDNSRFPIKIYIGKTYNNLTNITEDIGKLS